MRECVRSPVAYYTVTDFGLLLVPWNCCLAFCGRVWRRLKRVVLEVVIPTGRKVDLAAIQQGNFYSVVFK